MLCLEVQVNKFQWTVLFSVWWYTVTVILSWGEVFVTGVLHDWIWQFEVGEKILQSVTLGYIFIYVQIKH